MSNSQGAHPGADIYRDIINHSPCSYLVFEHGQCVYASDSYWDIVGYPPDMPLDQSATNPAEVVHPQDKDAVLRAYAQATRHRTPKISLTYRSRKKDGTYILRNDTVFLSYDEAGNHTGSYITVCPVTPAETGRIEEIIHRIKNDLALVRSMLYLQSRDVSSPEAVTALTAAAARIDAVGRVYDHIHRARHNTTVDLSDLLTEFLTDTAEKNGHTSPILSADIAPGLTVSGKLSTSVVVILNELITNAVKYAGTADGHPKITVTVTDDHPKTTLLIHVKDNGPGFPPSVLDRNHLGFGLEVVTALTEQNGGTTTFSNNTGAVVDILIPL